MFRGGMVMRFKTLVGSGTVCYGNVSARAHRHGDQQVEVMRQCQPAILTRTGKEVDEIKRHWTTLDDKSAFGSPLI